MHIQMKYHISGGRDGAPWPLAGHHIEVTDDEGNTLISIGAAHEVETADAPVVAVETAEVPPVAQTADAPVVAVETATTDSARSGK